MKIWHAILLSILLVTMSVLPACDLLGIGDSKQKQQQEYYRQQLEAYKKLQEAYQQQQEEYNKSLQKGLQEYLEKYQEYQQQVQQQQLQQLQQLEGMPTDNQTTDNQS